MGKLTKIWDGVDLLLSDPGSWVYSIMHRKQRWQVEDERGVSTYYAPEGISPDIWQKMICDKIGGETQHPRDISIQHQACLLHFTLLEEKIGTQEAFKKVSTEEIDVRKYVPEFLLPMYGIYPDKAEPASELPKP